MLQHEGYRLALPAQLSTPALLVYEDRVNENIENMCLLAGGPQNILPHVKTHKSVEITRKMLAAGITGFRCATLNELNMVMEADAKEVILAYPQVQPIKAKALCELVDLYRKGQIYAIVSAAEHVNVLEREAATRNVEIGVMLDLEIGMHRTGAELERKAEQLYQSIAASQHLRPAGFHAYDGHEHIVDKSRREEVAEAHIQDVLELKVRVEKSGLPVRRIVGGGSFSFPYWAQKEGMQGSPGTCIYGDFGYGDLMPDMPFHYAALVRMQIIDRDLEEQTVTTDLGYKAICSDPPLAQRARVLGYQRASLVGHYEEHSIFKWDGELPAVGTYLMVVPGHVCSTTVRYPWAHQIDAQGEVVGCLQHTARDR